MKEQNKSGTKKTARLLRWLIPLSLIAAALVFKGFAGKKEQAAPQLVALPVRTQKPVQGDLVKSLKLNAHVESETMVTVLPLVSGVLQELLVDVGEYVSKNQVIARIDAQRFDLQLKQAEAAYLSAKSSYERLAQLYKANAASQQSYEQAKGQYEAYASQYDLARLQLDYATVKSPVDGVVLMKHLSAGAIAAPERPLVTIGDLKDLIVRARVPERYYANFSPNNGLSRIVISRPGGKDYKGKVRSVSPFVSAETKNFEVSVAINGASEDLRPGMFVAVEFELARWPGVYSLPFEALGGGRLWWVEDGKAVSTPFIADKSSDTAFAVPSEWANRDFIVEGQYFAREGSKVSIIDKAIGASEGRQ